jgi:hypothetical protein
LGDEGVMVTLDFLSKVSSFLDDFSSSSISLLKDVSVSPNLVKGFTEVFSVSFSSISSKKGFFGFGGMAGAPSDSQALQQPSNHQSQEKACSQPYRMQQIQILLNPFLLDLHPQLVLAHFQDEIPAMNKC